MTRRRWRGYVLTALLLSVMAGVSMLAIAGARRTQSSYPRFLRDGTASTVSVSTFQNYDEQTNAAFAALPNVVQSRTYVGLNISVLVDGMPDFGQAFEASGTFDGRYVDQDRFAVTDGRMADQSRVDEVIVNQFAAARYGYRVGQHLQLGVYSIDQWNDPAFFLAPTPPVLTVDAIVVGIGLFPDEVVQDEADRTSRVHATKALTERARQEVTYGLQGLVLRNGDADVPAVIEAIESVTPPGSTEFGVTSVSTSHALHAVLPLSIAMAAFGAVTGLAAIALVGQALLRTLRSSRDERRMLTVFGAPRRVVVGSAVLAPLITVMVGALGAVVLAVAASPVMPLGPVREVEVDRGVSLDATVMAIGVVSIVLLSMSFVVVHLWRDARRVAPARRVHRVTPSRVVAAAAAAHVSPAALTGLRFTVGRDDGARVVSMRSVMGGAVLAVAAVTASLTFAGSLNTLVHEPRLYGWNWDAMVVAGNGYGNIDRDLATSILAQDPAVAHWSGTYFGTDALNGYGVQMLGMDADSGVAPPLLRGRMIATDDEIVLGPATASRLHVDIGDSVIIEQSGDRLTVVGIAVFPSVGKAHVAHVSLGEGAIVVPSRIPGWDRDILGDLSAVPLGPQAIFIDFSPGTDAAAALAHLVETTAPLTGFAGLDVLAVQRPAEIVHAGDIGSAPRVLAIGLAVAALISLTLGLVASVRSRAYELALLKSLGFSRRQLAAAVSWHATATVTVGVTVGVPLGVLLGRAAWTRFGDQMHVVAEPDVPVLAIAGISLFAFVVVNLIAAVPARSAQRVNAARALRSG